MTSVPALPWQSNHTAEARNEWADEWRCLCVDC